MLLWRPPSEAAALPISDSVEYAVSAARLARGDGYTLSVAGEVHPPRYPPGFPLLLAPVMALTGGDLGAGIVVPYAAALVSLLLIGLVCRRMLPGAAGLAATGFAFALTFACASFRRDAREVMADVPLLALSLVAWHGYVRARPLAAGVAIGWAVLIRPTALALALPFAGRLRAVVPATLGLGALLAYHATTFGSPFETGYHYWLPERGTTLSLAHVGDNLPFLLHPFLPNLTQRWFVELAVGPLTLLGVALAGALCRARRPEAWARTLPALRYVAVVGAVLVAFHLVYPFRPTRFLLFPYVALFTLGAVWAASFLDTQPTRAALGFCLPAAVMMFVLRPGAFEWPPRLDLVARLAALERVAPDDAVLVGVLDPALMEHLFVRDTERMFVPLARGGSFDRDPEFPVVPFRALEEPERVEALLDEGRRVFLDPTNLPPKRMVDEIRALNARFRIRGASDGDPETPPLAFLEVHPLR